jgi:hypothetical protein
LWSEIQSLFSFIFGAGTKPLTGYFSGKAIEGDDIYGSIGAIGKKEEHESI